MANMITNMIKTNIDLNDETIATNMLSSGMMAADAYLKATLTAPTPELRAMYSGSLNAIIGGHTALTELSVNRGWIKPYNSTIEQLSQMYTEAKTVVEEK